MANGPLLRTGIDVATVADVADSLARFGERYVERLFTRHEVESCSGTPAVTAAGLAARFAAKEATVKALGWEDAPLDWRSIEVRRARSGACTLLLSGEAAALAARRGVRELAVSLTHEGGIAAAVVVGLLEGHKSPARACRCSGGGHTTTRRARIEEPSGDEGSGGSDEGGREQVTPADTSRARHGRG